MDRRTPAHTGSATHLLVLQTSLGFPLLLCTMDLLITTTMLFLRQHPTMWFASPHISDLKPVGPLMYWGKTSTLSHEMLYAFCKAVFLHVSSRQGSPFLPEISIYR